MHVLYPHEYIIFLSYLNHKKVGESKDFYVKHFGSTMNKTDMNYEVDLTITEIKSRCARALQTLHESIGERVKPPDQNDNRILVSWVE